MIQYYNFWYWDKIIPHEICQKIIQLGEGEWSQAETFGSVEDNSPLSNVRKSDIVWINEQWVYDLIWGYMLTANKIAGWKYNIKAAENCQVTQYTKGGFYVWHNDGTGSHHERLNRVGNRFLHGNTRKLSMSIVLNSTYEGGDFEMMGLDDTSKVPRLEKGSVIVFPSFMVHRITPVTKGTRYSLVAWFVGPPFV